MCIILDIFNIPFQIFLTFLCIVLHICNFNFIFTYFCYCIWASSWENQRFAFAKTKPQISCAVTAQLISAFVFATQIVQSLFFQNPKFQASNHFLL